MNRLGLRADTSLASRCETWALWCVLLALGALTRAQSDTFWTLRAGRDLWTSQRVPLLETYSHSAHGLPWPNHEWLWQALAYPLFALGGFPLLTACAALLLVATHALILSLMEGDRDLKIWILAAGLGFEAIEWTLRPQLVTLFALAALLLLVSRRKLRWLPPLFLVWANCHGGVLVGLWVLVAIALAAALFARSELRALLPALAGSALATLCTPLGLGLYRFVWQHLADENVAGIEEWQPLSLATPRGACFVLVVLGLGALAALRFRRVRDFPGLVLLAASASLVFPAVRHVRNEALFALAAMPLAARLLASPREARASESPEPFEIGARTLAFIAVTTLAAIASAWTLLPRWFNWRPIRTEALSSLAACPGQLYNQFDDGGYLLWLAPERSVYIDNRFDPYPAEFLRAAFDDERRGVNGYQLLRQNMRCAFVRRGTPSDATLARSGWSARYRDEDYAVYAPD